MRSDSLHNWAEIYEEIRRVVKLGEVEPSITQLASYFDMPRSTLGGGLKTNFGITAGDLNNLPPLNDGGGDGGIGEPVPHEGETDKITVATITPNLVVLTSKRSEVVQTLDDLLKAAEVDTNTWDVSKHQVKTWSVPMRLRGGKDAPDQPVQIPIFYVAAYLVRKNPVPIASAIHPVHFHVPRPKLPAIKPGKAGRYLVINDAQIGYSRNVHSSLYTPYHDWQVLDIAQQLVDAGIYNGVYVSGDWMDLAAFSRFTKMPEFRNTTQLSLVEARYWLALLGVEKWVQGNHEQRLEKAIHGHTFEEVYGVRRADKLELPPVASLEYLLGLDTMDVEYLGGYPNNEIWIDDHVRIIHGSIAKAKPGHTASAIVEKSHVNTAFAHAHRREMAARRLREGQSDERWITAFCGGCACHVDGRVPGSRPDSNWMQGMTDISSDGNGLVTFTQVLVERGRAIVDGMIIEARDREEEIRDLHSDAIKRIDKGEKLAKDSAVGLA